MEAPQCPTNMVDSPGSSATATTSSARACSIPELLGWTIEPMEMGDGSTYELIKSGQTGIGGLMPLMAEQGPHPFWLSLSLSRQRRRGPRRGWRRAVGATLRDGFDIPGVGRIAVVADPQGAIFALFKGETGDPEEAEGPGSWWWNELWTSSNEDALGFYKSVFGYTHDSMEMADGGTYYILMQGEQPRAGLMTSPASEIPPHWLPYVRVDDCDQVAERAATLKGKVLWPPNDIPKRRAN